MSIRAVAYARFSSDNQRDESIDAQLRAINEYAKKNNIVIVDEYIDRAKTGTNADRTGFQQMLSDSAKHRFEMVIVHKFDRFARSRLDSAHAKSLLKSNGVKLISILEHMDDSPESIIYEGLIESINEYYSANLSREVIKGLKENALACKHTGGKPPLGYDVDKTTMKYVINDEEAEIVRFIFRKAKEGMGYSAIIHELNSRGWKSKSGNPFGKNSIHDILANEKYKGVYIFNKASAKQPNGKRNSHKYKSNDEIIRVPDGMPRIISDEDFDLVQKCISKRKLCEASRSDAKETYLLSGKITCGVCGCAYCGSSRVSKHNGMKKYVSYRCVKRSSKTSSQCKNKEVNRDYIEQYVLNLLSEIIFDEKRIPAVIEKYNSRLNESDSDIKAEKKRLNKLIDASKRKVKNLTNAIANTGSDALYSALAEEEKLLSSLKVQQKTLIQDSTEIDVDKAEIISAFRHSKELLKSGELPHLKQLINLYVKNITVSPEFISVRINALAAIQSSSDNEQLKKLSEINEDAFVIEETATRKELNSIMKEMGNRA